MRAVTLPPLRAAVLLGLSLAASSVLAADSSSSSDAPIVKDPIKNLSYLGTTTTLPSSPDTKTEHFLNIRFATAPRFSPPTPFLPSPGSTIDATSTGPACPQSLPAIPPFFSETKAISEDCLNLRISRPSGVKADAKLPVVVHIHGGGVVKGSAYDPHFDPDRLLALSTELGEPIIYVAINYRLTIFGFPRLSILKEQKSLNLGMRDQRAALEWVRDNIVHFGGDPSRVTAFGLSAGGTFTSLQMAAYGGAKGAPFTRAWMMSGPPGTALNMTSRETERHTQAVAERVGCGTEQGDDEEKLLECLRGVSMEELTEKAMAYSVENHPPAGLFTFIPSVDDDFIPDRQSVLYQSGKFVKGIPTILSWAQDDGATNAGPAPLFTSEESMIPTLHSFVGPSALSPSDIKTLFSLYPKSDFLPEYHSYASRRNPDTDPEAPIHYFRISRILRDILFTCSSIDFGYHLSRASYAADPEGFAGVRLYTLNQSMLTPLFKGAGMPYLGAVHGSDTNYIFNGVFPELGDACSEEDAKLAREMAGAFVRFAATGDPSPTKQKKGEEGWQWPEAFGGPEIEGGVEIRGLENLQGVNVHVIGGPVGTGSCKVRHHGFVEGEQDMGNMQKPIVGEGVEYGEMGGKDEAEEKAKKPEKVTRKREALLEREKLLKRCAFINTLNEKLGV